MTVRLPAETKAHRVKLLVSGQELPVTETGRELHLTVPSILDHEVIALDL